MKARPRRFKDRRNRQSNTRKGVRADVIRTPMSFGLLVTTAPAEEGIVHVSVDC